MKEIERRDLQEVISEIKLSELIPKLERVEPCLGHYYEVFLEEEDEGPSIREIVAMADTWDLLTNASFPKDRLPPGRAIDSMKEVGRFNQGLLTDLWIVQDKMRLLREEKVFLKMKETLQKKYPKDKFVVLSSGRVLAHGNEEMELVKGVYQKYGYIPIYLGQLRGERRVIHMPSIHSAQEKTGEQKNAL